MVLERRGQVPTVPATPGASPEVPGVGVQRGDDMPPVLDNQETTATQVLGTTPKDGVASELDTGDELKLIFPSK